MILFLYIQTFCNIVIKKSQGSLKLQSTCVGGKCTELVIYSMILMIPKGHSNTVLKPLPMLHVPEALNMLCGPVSLHALRVSVVLLCFSHSHENSLDGCLDFLTYGIFLPPQNWPLTPSSSTVIRKNCLPALPIAHLPRRWGRTKRAAKPHQTQHA